MASDQAPPKPLRGSQEGGPRNESAAITDNWKVVQIWICGSGTDQSVVVSDGSVTARAFVGKGRMVDKPYLTGLWKVPVMRSQLENRCLSKGVAFAPGPQFWWVFEESSGPRSGPDNASTHSGYRAPSPHVRGGPFDGTEVFRGKVDVRRSEVFFKAMQLGCAWNRNDPRLLGELIQRYNVVMSATHDSLLYARVETVLAGEITDPAGHWVRFYSLFPGLLTAIRRNSQMSAALPSSIR